MDEKSQKSHRAFLIFLLILVPVLFLLGWSQASLNLSFIHPRNALQTFLLAAVSAFVFIAFVNFALILMRILLELLVVRQQNQLGSRFKTKMVAEITEALARQSQQTALESSQRLARLEQLQTDLETGNLTGLTRLLRRQSENLQRASLLCLDSSGHLLARAGEPEPAFEEIRRAFPALNTGKIPSGGLAASIRSANSELFLALQRVEDASGKNLGAVIAVHRLPLNIQQIADQIQQESQRYDQLSREKNSLKRLYLLILLLLTLLILFVATWFAMFFSKQV